MGLFSNKQEVTIPGLARGLREIADGLVQIAQALTPPPAPSQPSLFKVVGLMEVPRQRSLAMIATGNHFFDTVLLRMAVAPNGVIDSPPSWSCDTPDIALVVSADGLSCDAQADVDVAAFAITVTAPADIPSTPDLESVSETFTGSFSHSKATALGATFSEIPRA